MTEQAIRVLHCRQPDAYAVVKGSPDFPGIRGMVWFFEFLEGTLVCAEVSGLPQIQRMLENGMYAEDECRGAMYGFHLHEGGSCTGTPQDPFANAGGHYNPGNCMHPDHAGDFPVLLGNRGYAWQAFYTDRFTPAQAKGKTVIIHEYPDDYHSQPSGNSGPMIACGEVK
jgi:Cu-Zn family superoxide dismutase